MFSTITLNSGNLHEITQTCTPLRRPPSGGRRLSLARQRILRWYARIHGSPL